VMAEQNERMAQRRRRTAGTKPVDPHACDRYAVPVPLPSSRAHWRLPGGIAAIPSGDSNSRAPRVSRRRAKTWLSGTQSGIRQIHNLSNRFSSV
jgi:hypothetical protein